MVLAASALVAASLAGCMEALDESRTTGDGDGAQERRIVVDVPEGATAIRVEATATRVEGEADVTLLIEDASGENLAEDTFSVGASATRALQADAAGHDRLVVVARVVDGEAELDVKVYAVVPGQPEVVVVREVVVLRVETTQAPPPAATTTPPPASTPVTTTQPTPTPPPTATPPTNATNATNSTNGTATG